MKRSTYDERDYAFGQMVLTLRTNLGLTQAGLAAEGRPFDHRFDEIGVGQVFNGNPGSN